MSNPAIPAAWNDAAVLDGPKIEDKSKLLDIPFLITGCEFKTNARNVQTVYIDAQFVDGSEFTFTDSSVGVRLQIIDHLTGIGKDAAVDTGEYVKFRLVAPEGLRFSEYPVPNPRNPRAEIMAKTYYLTTSGKRAGAESAEKTAPVTRAGRK